MFNWIVSDAKQYLELFNFVELLEIELFDYLIVYLQNVFTNDTYKNRIWH